MGANRIHLRLAPIGVDDRQRGVEALGTAKVDSFIQLLEFGADMGFESRHSGLLGGVGSCQPNDVFEPNWYRCHSGIVRIEISIAICQQKAALPGFSVL